MDDTEFEKYLKERYNGQTRWYEKKSVSNKRWYVSLHFVLIILSALTPLLIALDFVFSEVDTLQWVSIFTSLTVAVIASSLKTFKFQEHWVNYRTTAELLKKEQYYYEGNTKEYSKTQDKRATFVKRVENLISQAHTSWAEEYQLRVDGEE